MKLLVVFVMWSCLLLSVADTFIRNEDEPIAVNSAGESLDNQIRQGYNSQGSEAKFGGLFDPQFIRYLQFIANNPNKEHTSPVDIMQRIIDAIVEIHNTTSPESSRVLLLPVSALGLANRLRIIASFFPFAANVKLLVLWLKDEACNISADDLFTVSPELQDQLAFISIETAMSDQVFQQSIASWTKQYPHQVVDHYFKRFLVDQNLMQQGKINIIFTRGSHAWYDSINSGFDCKQWMASKSRFHQALQPSPPLQSLLQSFRDSYLNTNPDNKPTKLIGVHIRAFDPSQDWAVVTPHFRRGSSDEIQISKVMSFDQSSPLQPFIALMQQMLLEQDENVRFFVASNSLSVKQQLLDIFGEEFILTLVLPESEGNQDRTSHLNLVLAFVEFQILGECDLILHSRGSSFAREAAFKHQVPVIDVGSNREAATDQSTSYLAFFSLHHDLPYCASPELIREVTQLQHEGRLKKEAEESVHHHIVRVHEKICFEEEGDRTMCSHLYSLCPCLSINLHVYCNLDTDSKQCVEVIAESNGYSL